jgi:hypothetical protein
MRNAQALSSQRPSRLPTRGEFFRGELSRLGTLHPEYDQLRDRRSGVFRRSERRYLHHCSRNAGCRAGTLDVDAHWTRLATVRRLAKTSKLNLSSLGQAIRSPVPDRRLSPSSKRVFEYSSLRVVTACDQPIRRSQHWHGESKQATLLAKMWRVHALCTLGIRGTTWR